MALSLERVSTATEISDDLTRIRNENYEAIENEVNAKPDLGEVTGTAYDGAKGKANADDISTLQTEKASLDTVPTFNGIKFPSTQVASADVNTLDDYEEGTWTPILSRNDTTPATHVYVVQKGSYVKIGKKVTAYFSIQTSSSTSMGDGTIRIKGLPFVASSDLPYYMSGDIGYFSLLTLVNAITINAGSTEIAMLNTNVTTSLLYSEWKTTGGYAVGSITYLTD